MFELAQYDGVAQVEIGRGRVHAQLHAQRLATGAGFYEFGAEFRFANDFRRAFFNVGELLVNRGEVGHAVRL